MTTQKENFKHEYKCDICGKPAVVNVQDVWHVYDIDEDGNLTEVKSRDGDTSEFYCKEHQTNA